MVTVTLLIVTLTLLLLSTCPVCHARSYRVAWLAPEVDYYGFRAASSVGGLGLAVDDVTNTTNHDFKIRWENSDCKSNVSLARMYDVLVKDSWDPEVIIGPPCSSAMAFIGQLAGYRNLPILGWVSDSTSFGDKGTYDTLIRVLPPINAIGQALMHTMEFFNWRSAILLSSSGALENEVASSVNTAFKARDGYQLSRWESGESDEPTAERLDELCRTIKKEARIVILVVSRSSLRTWLLAAARNKMTDGDYVFVYINGEHPTASVISALTGSSIWSRGDGSDVDAEQAFKNVLMFVQSPVTQAGRFQSEANSKADAWGDKLDLPSTATSDNFAPYLHDAVRLYAQLADEAIMLRMSYKDGRSMLSNAKNRVFSGTGYVTSPILLDENGDRRPNYVLYDMSADGSFSNAQLTKASIVNGTVHTGITEINPVVWGDDTVGRNNTPTDLPACGFDNEKCPDLVLYIVPPVVFVVLVIIAVAGFLIYRRMQFEQSIKDMAWKLQRDELKTNKKKDHLSVMMAGSKASSMLLSRASGLADTTALVKSQSTIGHRSGNPSIMSSAVDDKSQIFVNVAKYKGNTVAIKAVRKQKIKLDRDLLVEMRNMTNLKSSNLATMIGATTEAPEVYEVWEYCPKGSLQDVIWNDNISLDDMFKYSISIDMFKGLKYLHDSPLKLHGRLKSSNCVIDGRWSCKLTDFGLFKFRDGATPDPEMTDYSKATRLFWMAPEFLRKSSDFSVSGMSQEADVYAAGIIMKELFTRNGPYSEFEDDMEPEEMLEKIKNRVTPPQKPFRPSFEETRDKCPDKLLDLMRQCWSEKPSDRVSPSHAIKDLQKINPNKSNNVMDNMIRMMERYTNHLEDIVGERTQQVEEEKKKSDMLLMRMLPKPIAEDLKRGKTVAAESFDSVSLYFSDIVSFTALSAQSTPLQVVDFLNRLYTIFDSAIAKHDVYKVETIGDAYMLVSGLPNRNGDNHAVEIANAAMDLLSGIVGFKVDHMPEDYELRIRIGLHTGPSVAGVVGVTMPRYCLFGNTVSIAQTMESGGAPMRIHMSQNTYDILKKFTGYTLAARNDPLDVKGLGKVNTYWIVNREGYNKPFPNFDELSAADSPKPTKFPMTKGKTFKSSLAESEALEYDPVTNTVSRKISEQEPTMPNISEENAKNKAHDDQEPDENSNPVNKTKKVPQETAKEPQEDEDVEESWAQPGQGAKLKSDIDPLRPSTATSLRTRLNISKPEPLSDMQLEDTMIIDDVTPRSTKDK